MNNDNPSYFQGAQYPDHLNHPVEQVSREDCYGNQESFCHKLTEKLKSQGNWEFRLPSEAEWEYACRAGTTTKYYFGDNENELSDYAWYQDNSERKTHPVGQLKPNNFGLYDISGNVWEWCLGEKEIRGGAWDSVPDWCRSANRNSANSSDRSFRFGLRVVCVL
ncbi:MAG: formylglycine-generating enzyme family protein [Moorea sp. SIO2I5]|nr:formylglycine-generating enzyme family protein [Moorena sp. SIO2I5]